MQRDRGLPVVIFVFLTLCLISPDAFAGEQCIAHFDALKNMIRIPCLVVGDQEFWANLKLTSPDQQLRFEVHSFGQEFLPLWLTQMIREFENNPVTNPPRMITQYEFQGSIVYDIPSPCCDQFNYVYDTSGNVICAPSGGLSGIGDGRCPNFYDESKHPVIVWRDMRG